MNIGTKTNLGLIRLLFMILCHGKLKGERSERLLANSINSTDRY